ncbi:MAG: serine protease, partial [Prevotellaceae bacterium]|nr:serine protease [Prevotellaceae bacterium]
MLQAVSLQSVEAKKMQSFDVAKLLKEDKQNEDLSDIPFRFGYTFDVNYTLNDGVWERHRGNNVWSLKIKSEGAYSLNFIFEELYLTEDEQLFIFNSSGTMVYGPVTKEQNIQKDETFLTDVIIGDEVIIQLVGTKVSEYKEKSFLRISKVVHGYKNIFASITENNIVQSLGQSAICNNDMACYPNWELESNAVALVLLSNGTEACSGSLLNNTSQNYKPYFLSAFHCIDADQNGVISTTEKNNAQNWMFRFKYKKSTCNGSTVTSYVTYNQATFRAAWLNTDFLLMELSNFNASTANVTYLGWDRTGNNPSSGTCIHHPRGDAMKISFDNNTITSNTSPIPWDPVGTIISPVNTHWVVEFDNGVVEHGSSGAPLFDQNKRVVGQLHGNHNYNQYISYCNQPQAEYGKFNASWVGGGSDATGLCKWLDLTNSGTEVLDALIYITGNDNPYSFQQVTYTIPNLPTGTNVTWSGSSNVNIISGQGTNQVTISVCGGDAATLTSTLSGMVNTVLTKNLTVNNGTFTVNRYLNN